jgi:hypothetical protein
MTQQSSHFLRGVIVVDSEAASFSYQHFLAHGASTFLLYNESIHVFWSEPIPRLK